MRRCKARDKQAHADRIYDATRTSTTISKRSAASSACRPRRPSHSPRECVKMQTAVQQQAPVQAHPQRKAHSADLSAFSSWFSRRLVATSTSAPLLAESSPRQPKRRKARMLNEYEPRHCPWATSTLCALAKRIEES